MEESDQSEEDTDTESTPKAFRQTANAYKMYDAHDEETVNMTSGEVVDLVSDEEDVVEQRQTGDAFTFTAGVASDVTTPPADRPTAADEGEEKDTWYVAGGRRGDKGARRHKSRACHHLRTQTHVDTIKAVDVAVLKKHKPCKRCSSK